MSAKTNDMRLSFAPETSLGTLPGTPEWVEADRLGIDSWGSTVNKTEINPTNQNAMKEKGIVTDIDSTVGYNNNLTISGLLNHVQGALRSNIKAQVQTTPTSVAATDDSFAHAAISAAVAEGSLIYARDFTNTANNGLHVVGAASTTIKTITTSVLVDEASPPANSRFNVVGVQGAAGDIEIDADNNLTSTVLDFTTLGLNVGQSLWIGGSTAITQFDTADYIGLVRVKVITATKITIEERPWTIGAVDDGGTQTIQLFFGDFIRNVPRSDGDYNPESYTFEGKFTDLEAGNAIVYEYPVGNRVNELGLTFPMTDKAGISWGFVGTDTPNPTTSEASGDRNYVYDNKGFGTSSDCVFLKVKNSSKVDYTTTFTDFSINVSNTINPRKVLCTDTAVDLNDGDVDVKGSVQALLSDENMISAVRNNEKLTLSYAINNTDGALDFYMPALTFNTKTTDTPENDNITLSFDLETYRDEFYNFVLGITHFHFLPV